MKKQKTSDVALGIFVNPNRVDALLLRSGEEGVEIVGQFSRQRIQQGELSGVGSLVTSLPGLKRSDEADYTIQVGSGSGSNGASDLFMSSEFVGLGGAKPGTKEDAATARRSLPFAQQLHEILLECHNIGFSQPRIAFCIDAPDVSYVELYVTHDEHDNRGFSLGSGGLIDGVPRRKLIDLLAAQHKAPFDKTRVTFLPMTVFKGQQRFLAVMPEPGEPVQPTLETLIERKSALAPAAQLLGTEVSLYCSMARQLLAPLENENTAIVRIGSDATLVLFLTGGTLNHIERLRSLSSYDPPETICSRVLLQQDEQKIGEVHYVLVSSDGRAPQFERAFRQFYPRASVKPLHGLLQQDGIALTEEEDGVRAGTVAATGIARQLLHEVDGDPFADVNLLPKKLRGKQRQGIGVAWHSFAMLAVLFVATFFFVTRYLEGEVAIDTAQQELALLTPNDPNRGTVPLSVLRARVDSLQQVHARYTRALHVLDSLLVGSDQWTRTMETTARATGELSGTWFTAWQPHGLSIRLTGNATARERVAQLARRLGGTIEGTSFAEVNEVRIHPFTMVVPRPIGMPRVADYLRENVDQQELSAARPPTNR